MKLFVDDLRVPPKDWVLARTITEAIRLIDTESVEEVSLDHDICYVNTDTGRTADETFEPVARYIAVFNQLLESQGIPEIKVQIHTANPVGAQRMRNILEGGDNGAYRQ